MVKHCFLYSLVDCAEALNLFLAHNNRYNDEHSVLLSINQLQEDSQYERKFLASNTDSELKQILNTSIILLPKR